jgi:voltage-gated potassium channel
MTYLELRRETYRVLDPQATRTPLERSGNILINLLILANVLAVILESVSSIGMRYATAFDWFEAVSVYLFTIEYILRLWTCVEREDYRHPVFGRLRYAVSPLALIDLAVILPGLMPGQRLIDLRFARIARLVRMLRVFKFARYSSTLQTFGVVFRDKRSDIALMLLFLSILVVISSSLMYLVEHDEQPDKFSSIPAAMWWSVMTLTTVGYGDILPVSALGKVIASFIALVGIGFFALPAGVLSAAFADELARQREASPKVCPHCGGHLKPEKSGTRVT